MDLNVLIQQKGWLLTFGTVFLWGLAMNLTPCVYPMIPITISYFGGMGGGKAGRSSLLALLFVIGLAITYSVLGVSAAMTGRLFGASLGNPWMVGLVSLVMAAMGLSLLGVFQITVSSGLLSAIQNQRDRMGWLGAFFFGLVAGIVMAPCVGPFIVSLLAFVAAKRDPLLGFWLFFTLAFGMGLPYLVLGTFTGALKSLPRPGSWMLWLERVFGLVLIGFAMWLWRPFLDAELGWRLLALYVLAAGIYLGFIERSGEDRGRNGFGIVKRALGVCAVGAALWLGLATAPPAASPGAQFQWQTWSDELLRHARANHEPIMIDFYATWCAACNELDHKTYSDPQVRAAAQRFICIKVDLTQGDIEKDAAAKPYHLKGLPTVVFIGPDGHEIERLRLEEFAPPRRMLQLMGQVPGSS